MTIILRDIQIQQTKSPAKINRRFCGCSINASAAIRKTKFAFKLYISNTGATKLLLTCVTENTVFSPVKT